MKDLQVTYRLRCTAAQVEARTQAIAVETEHRDASGGGSQQPCAGGDWRVREIEPMAPFFLVRVGLSLCNDRLRCRTASQHAVRQHLAATGCESAGFQAGRSGNGGFSGPRFGIEGLRARVGVIGRPLIPGALKPQGSTAAELAQIAARWRAVAWI